MKKNIQFTRGSGALSLADTGRAVAALRSGETQQAAARRLGVTKNVVAGLWARHGDHVNPSTMFERLDALHADLDRVIAETRDVGCVPNVPKLKVVR